MKICMLTTTHNPMDSRIFYKEAKTLKTRYEDVTVIAPDTQEFRNEEGINIVGINRAGSLKERYKLVDELISKAEEINADVYHFHDYEILLKIKRLRKSLPKCKIIYDVHEDFPDMMSMSTNVPHYGAVIMSKFVAATERFLAPSMDYVITADDAVEKRFLRFNKNTKVIYNYPSVSNVMEIQKARKDFDIIYEGALTLERGIFELVKSVALVKASYKPDVKLLLLYNSMDASIEKVVKPYIENNGLTENVIFISRVPHSEVPSYISRCKVGAVLLKPYAKYFKNIPIKQFEYMSCGVPVVGSNLPTISRFINKYNSGIVVEPNNIEEVAEGFISLLSDEKLREGMGQNGIYSIKNDFNWEKMSGNLIDIYDSLIN